MLMYGKEANNRKQEIRPPAPHYSEPKKPKTIRQQVMHITHSADYYGTPIIPTFSFSVKNTLD